MHVYLHTCMYVSTYKLWFNFLLPIFCLNVNWYFSNFFPFLFHEFLLHPFFFEGAVSLTSPLRMQYSKEYLCCTSLGFYLLIFWCAVWQLSPFLCWIIWRHSTPTVNHLSVYDETEHLPLTPSLCHLLSNSLRLCFSTSLAGPEYVPGRTSKDDTV